MIHSINIRKTNFNFFNALIKLISILLIICLASCSNTHANDDVQDKHTRIAELNIQLGLKYLEIEDYQRAKQRLLTALRADPNLPETNYALGYFYETTGDLALANKYYLTSIKLAPNRGDVQNNYGTYLCRHGQYDEAIKHFNIAVADKDYLDPASAYENAGWCSLKMNDKKQATRYFKLAVMHDPDRTSALTEWKYLTRKNQ